MRKLLLALAATVAVAACSPKATTAPHTVYHLKDGRYAYNDNGIWFYLWMMQGNQQTYVYGSAGTPASSYSGASWSRGTSPTQQQVTEAEEEQDQITTNPEGEPVAAEEAQTETESEATTSEGTSEGASDGGSTADSGGGGGDAGGGGGDGGGGDGGGGGGGE